MAKPKSPYKRVRASAYFLEPLHKELILLLEDPVNPGKIPYGVLSKYINQLVVQDLRERKLIGEDALDKLENFIEKEFKR